MTNLLFMPGRPRRGRFFAAAAAGFFWREVRRPGSALRPPPRLGARYRAKLGIWRAGTPSPSRKGLRDLNAGQNSPANHPASTFVLPSADPPRRGFRSSAELRFLTPAPGQCTTPSATQAAPNRPSYPQNFSRFARKPGRCPVSARQRGSRGLNVPLAPSLRSLF